MRFKAPGIFLPLLIFLAAVFSVGLAQGKASVPDPVAKVFQGHCSVRGCHEGRGAAGNLDLSAAALAKAINAASMEKPQLKIIDAQSPDNSYLLMKIRGDKDIVGGKMPLGRTALSEGDIKIIRDWIESLKGGPLDDPAQAGASLEGNELKKKFEKPAFWGTRLINLPTTRTMDKGDVLFRVSHRFLPPVSSGYDAFYGLDGPAFVLLSLGYGIGDNFGVTLGRANQYQELELGLDWLALEQDATPALPFALAVHAGGAQATLSIPGRSRLSSENFKFNVQATLSRQFTNEVSLMIVPCYSSNVDQYDPNPQGTFSLGFGGRFLLFDDVSLIGEYLPVLSGYKPAYDAWGLGIEKKIGGHVFQVFILNSVGLTSDQFIAGGDLKGDVRLGFNIFRTF